jgi:hypothetical protein
MTRGPLIAAVLVGLAICAGSLTVQAPVAALAPAAALAPIAALAPTAAPTAAPTLAPTAIPTIAPTVAPTLAPTPKPTVKPTARPAAKTPRLSIPALGINAAIQTPKVCGAAIPNGIWVFTCGGRNNLYLQGHAWGVFAPLHNAYHKGSLKAGMIAVYTDRAAKAHRYKLQWVKDLPFYTFAEGDSWATTAGPVITLQTCDGATSDYRIIARFVPA